MILSHLQRPTAALLSHTDVDGESVHWALLAVQENWAQMTNWAVPPEPACLEQRTETEPLIACHSAWWQHVTRPPSWQRLC